jgi:hypothetical protein
MDNLVPKSKARHQFWPSAVGIALIFAPLPLGLRSAELSALTLLGIAWLYLIRYIWSGNMRLPLVLIGVAVAGTMIAVFRGDPFVPFQFFRGIVFPLLLIWLLQAHIKPRFFQDIERTRQFLVSGAILSAIIYFGFESDFYNSTLDIPFEDAQYKRFFVFPTYFFLLLFFDSVAKRETIQVIYVLLLAASGSKAIYLSIALIYGFFFFNKISAKRSVTILFMFMVIGAAAYYGGLLDRIADFVEFGDPWRYYEPLAAIQRLADPVRFFFGNGVGIPYWEGRTSIMGDDGEASRVIINSLFDVHNGYLALGLKFGIPLTIWYMLAMFRSLPRVKGRSVLAIVIGMNILLSHGPVQMVEAVGLALGIRLVAYRAESVRRNRVISTASVVPPC